ncbi:Adenosylcobalamin/alpha-ribazole phosphatase [Cercospora zeina]
MDLYLIRHGETVDNVAGLYAGVTDSALTNHGVDQIKRLGDHFASSKVIFTHIFASPLSRAFKTAQAIQSAQPLSGTEVEITKVQDLIEQNFGFYEKRTFQARTDARKSGREAHRELHVNDPGFVDVESKEAMSKRADNFLHQHLIPLLDGSASGEKLVVAIVSHGMLLSQLWKRLLLKMPPKSVTIAPEVTAAKGQIVLQHLGGWSNTGYLELSLSQNEAPESEEEAHLDLDRAAKFAAESINPNPSSKAVAVEQPTPTASGFGQHKLLIVSIDRKDHLTGLKRQRGGIGRSKHDEGQRKLDGFFKRQRTS